MTNTIISLLTRQPVDRCSGAGQFEVLDTSDMKLTQLMCSLIKAAIRELAYHATARISLTPLYARHAAMGPGHISRYYAWEGMTDVPKLRASVVHPWPERATTLPRVDSRAGQRSAAGSVGSAASHRGGGPVAGLYAAP